MIFSLIKTCLFSLLFIALIHHLFIFLKNMLTIPKIKDLVNTPTERYNEIFDTLQKISSINKNKLNSINDNDNENNENNENNKDNMNSELSNFLQELKTSNPGNNQILNKVSSFSEINNNDVGGSATIMNGVSSTFSEF